MRFGLEGETILNASGRTATFVMTDVVGSTALWELAPDQMHIALDLHDSILDEEAGSAGGRVIKSRGEGDSAFIVFEDAAAALRFAAATVRRFGEQRWPTPRPVSVRVALHRGWAVDRDADYVGPAVNRCARLRSLAHGGQILVSDEVHDEAAARLGDELWLIDLGRHRLRDVVVPERVWQLCHADLPADFPPLGSEKLTPTNLPVPLTSFLGREEELRALADADGRLITLHGAGGLGKTRLALEHASRRIAEHPDGVWYVPLDAVGDDEGVTPAIVAALGLRAPKGDGARAVEAHLASRRALLVLDNAEHVLEATARIASRLLQACPRVRILVTSREALGVPGESVVTLRPFDVPEDDRIDDATAVRLFVERARLREHGFSLSDDNRDAIARICRLLDGMPLAIELAAARIGAFDAPKIAELLADRFRILSDGPRTVPDRQRSMRAAIEWSVALLDERLVDVFEQLSVYAGSFTLDAAAAVVGADAPDLVSRLVERSMLVAEPAEDGMRYRYLFPIGAYAAERLRTRPDADDVRTAALGWAAHWIEMVGHAADVAACANEWANFRALLSSATPTGDAASLRLATALVAFFQRHGLTDEGMRIIEAALDRDGPAAGDVLAARAHSGRGVLAMMNGALDDAEAAFVHGIEAAGRAADEHEVAAALGGLGEIARARGDYTAAESRFEETVAILRRLGEPSPLAMALGNHANLLHAQRRFGEARAALEEALALAGDLDVVHVLSLSMRLGQVERAEGLLDSARERFEMCVHAARRQQDRRGEGAARSMLGGTLFDAGEIDAAVRELEEGLRIRREIGDVAGIAASTYSLGDLLIAQGDLTRAGELLDESKQLWEQMRAPLGEAAVLHAEALLARARGDLVAAEEAARGSLEVFRTLGDREGIAVSLATLGGIAVEAGEARRGVELLGASSEVARVGGFARSKPARDRMDTDRAAGKDALGAAFEEAWDAGVASAMEDAER